MSLDLINLRESAHELFCIIVDNGDIDQIADKVAEINKFYNKIITSNGEVQNEL